jgi:ATP-dependent RNA helicase SUPV3L1/SUV3
VWGGASSTITACAHTCRGWAWTRALLSAASPEVHLCGDPSTVGLVRRIAELTGDSVRVHEYERLSPLSVARTPLRRVVDVEPGDCVVAFSRSNLYSLKESIERGTGLRCGVVYGSLPPAVRKQQAAQFNDPNGGLDVLVGECVLGVRLLGEACGLQPRTRSGWV